MCLSLCGKCQNQHLPLLTRSSGNKMIIPKQTSRWRSRTNFEEEMRIFSQTSWLNPFIKVYIISKINLKIDPVWGHTLHLSSPVCLLSLEPLRSAFCLWWPWCLHCLLVLHSGHAFGRKLREGVCPSQRLISEAHHGLCACPGEVHGTQWWLPGAPQYSHCAYLYGCALQSQPSHFLSHFHALILASVGHSYLKQLLLCSLPNGDFLFPSLLLQLELGIPL